MDRHELSLTITCDLMYWQLWVNGRIESRWPHWIPWVHPGSAFPSHFRQQWHRQLHQQGARQVVKGETVTLKRINRFSNNENTYSQRRKRDNCRANFMNHHSTLHLVALNCITIFFPFLPLLLWAMLFTLVVIKIHKVTRNKHLVTLICMNIFCHHNLLTCVDWTRIIADVEAVDWIDSCVPVMVLAPERQVTVVRGEEGEVVTNGTVIPLDLLPRRWRGGGGGGNNNGILVTDEPLCPLESDAGDAQMDATGDELKLEGDERPLMELERLLDVEPVLCADSVPGCSVK